MAMVLLLVLAPFFDACLQILQDEPALIKYAFPNVIIFADYMYEG